MAFEDGILSLVDKWASVDLLKETVDIAEDNEKQIADYNREQLYEKGEDSTGRKLKKYKNAAYAGKKNKINPEIGYGNADHFLTGETSRSIFADVRNTSIVLDAASRVSQFLVERDGPAIYGLQDESRIRIWNEVLRAPLIHKINSLTGAKIVA